MAERKIRIDGQTETIKMVLAAMFIALAFVLEMVTKFIPFLRMPNGGSISLTMLPLILAALYLGPAYGVICGVGFGLLNFLFDGMALHWGSFFLDYTVAFGLIGLVGFLRPKFYSNLITALKTFILATVIACFLRYLSSSFSGVLFFSAYAPEGVNAWFYSFILYNAAYIGPSMILCIAVGMAAFKQLHSLTRSPTLTRIYKKRVPVVEPTETHE